MQTLKIPFLIACSTAIIQVLWTIWTFNKDKKEDSESASYSLVRANGGMTRLVFRIGRVIGICVLLACSVISLRNETGMLYLNPFSCPEAFMTCTYIYCTILSIAALVSDCKNWRLIASKSISIILLSTWCVYAYRDLWPLATYTLQPEDMAEGQLMWFKISVLTLIGIIMPLFIPRRYVPVDPKNPMPVPMKEQTASWISFLTFAYMDQLIALGSKLPHIPVDALPVILDSDDSHYTTEKGFAHLDRFRGAPDRHLFWGLLRHYSRELIIMNIMDVCIALSALTVPAGLNKMLQYLETHGENATIRPWFWVMCLFFGPAVRSVAEEAYLYNSSQLNYLLKALLTELVFEHSLRIRLTSDDDGNTRTGNESQSKAKSTGNLTGRINNAITTDAGNITDGIHFCRYVFATPFSLIITIALLYQILGWSSTVTLLFTVLLGPLSGYVGTFLQKYEKVKMHKTDTRVQKTSEVVSVLRMVKLFGWEQKMIDAINDTRREELAWLWKVRIMRQVSQIVGMMLPIITQWATYATLTVALRGDLVPSKIFSSLILFSSIRYHIQEISSEYGQLVTAKVSLDRVNSLLRDTELLDSFSNLDHSQNSSVLTEQESSKIGFKDCSFAWSAKDSVTETSTSNATTDRPSGSTTRSFRLTISDEILFREGKLNVITGPTGCGKTSILLALLGELHYTPLSSDGWVNLPRAGGVAYAAQESWVLNATIRENILFGSAFDEDRYQKVISQCALGRDLELFEAGDKTEVGERGLTLSGGQKARLTLARAVYSPAQIILLDDIFAALDVHTSASIANECLGGEIMSGRTVILITHNLPLVMPLSPFLLTMSGNGSIVTEDIDINPDTVPAIEEILKKSVEDENNEKVPTNAADKAADGKLILAEEVARGNVKWESFKLLLHGLGGDHFVVWLVAWMALMFTYEMLALSQTWFLGYWGSKYEGPSHEPVSAWYYLSIYAGLLCISLIFASVHRYYYFLGTMRASEVIHVKLVESVLTSTLRWLDETPTGRILARFTQDMRTVDGNLTGLFSYLMGQVVAVTARFASILIFTPAFLIPGMLVGCTGLYLGNMYLRAQLSTKREQSNALSPMLAHFSASIHGLVSIRAYGAQAAFKEESLQRINHYVRISRPSFNLNRWIGIRIDLLGAVFNSSLAAYLVYGPAIGASDTGFILSVASSFMQIIYIMVRMFNMVQVESNSLERIQDYLKIHHEPPSTEAGKPPAAWPTSGDLRVENLCARYSKTGPLVLHNLTFHIPSGQRIGVVGRTGSGKSSLTLSLLRCILTEGEVFYDGLLTSRINLEALRSSITIIPQTPELLSGTLRQNLDPFGKEDDATLNDALRSAGLFALQEAGGDAKISLDTNISGGGSNLSVGQRQILALARAILRRSKLLILDEATSAIDYKTDSIIQNTLRTQLESDVTVITVAHRLQTIMDSDKIMVLDAGKLVEFDTPANLLRNPGSTLRSMVENSKDSGILQAMVGGVDNNTGTVP